MEALYGWVGTDLLNTPVLADGQLDLLGEYDVQHCEVIDLPSAEEAEGAEQEPEPALNVSR